ncbi:MAG TPA: 50S ribosomal protein L1 [Ignavibacteria bacterium]|nr:50S ribosomal protein L1 [Bacteroidota bacterium]HRI84489.1 50S ribosomal protein L1 [Ignavibacteria bacterium]HRJ98871.1 50S ribosomal protein L1 [Ignavibacteria bacterium]
MKLTKKQKDILKKVDIEKEYDLKTGVTELKKTASAKFDESVDVAVRLGVDPKHADQVVRGTVSLPHGTGKTVRVLVIAKPEKHDEAREAGADHVGYEDYVKKIQEGWTDIDVIIAAPDTMAELGKIGKILGPRGLMPNPKSGTVTPNIGQAVKDVKAGKIDFRVDKSGIVHSIVGKVSFDENKLTENITAFIDTIIKLKPAAAKGTYVKSITLSTTMGPGIKIDKNQGTAKKAA